MNRRKNSWADIPSEILSDIAERLELRSDILNFRAVCNTWRNSAPFSLLNGKNTILSPILPYHFSVNPTQHTFILRNPLVLVASSFYLIQSIVNPNLPPWLFAVEEFNPGKLFLRRDLSRSVFELFPVNFPKALDLSSFRVSELSKVYTLSFVPEQDVLTKHRNSFHFRKVILDSSRTSRIDDCSVLLLHDDALMSKIRVHDGVAMPLSCQNVKKFDDVITFKGRVYVIDRKGRVYLEEDGVLGRSLVVYEPIGEGLGSDRKKRLVESCGVLYLIYRCPRYVGVAFKIYKMNEEKKKWDELNGVGDDRILIAAEDGCFFVPAKDIPTWRGNCLVFGRGVFPAYNSVHGADSEIFKCPEDTTFPVGVFHFGSGECKRIQSYPGYTKVFWPPPPWLSSDRPLPKRDSHKDGDAEWENDVEKCPESRVIKKISCSLGLQADTQDKDCNSSIDIQENQSIKDYTTRHDSPTCKSLETSVSKAKFQGVDVSSDLLPTLVKIWSKHGNILEGFPVQSSDLVAWSLESMAKVVILLQNTSGRLLNDSEADYLSSTLCDLQFMRLNISWLVPSVVKALKMYKSSDNRQKLEDTLKEIGKVATQVADMKTKFLAEVGMLEQILDEQREVVCESLNVIDRLNGTANL